MMTGHRQTALAGSLLISAAFHGLVLGLFTHPAPLRLVNEGATVIQATLSPTTIASIPTPPRIVEKQRAVNHASETEKPVTKVVRNLPTQPSAALSNEAAVRKLARATSPPRRPMKSSTVEQGTTAEKTTTLKTASELKQKALPSVTPNALAQQQSRPTETASRTQHPHTQPQRGEQLHDDVRQHLIHALRERFRYPMLARRRGWQGVVKLRFLVRSNGEIADVQLASSSGFRALDKDALKTARQLQQLPQRLVWKSSEVLTLELPVRYRLSG